MNLEHSCDTTGAVVPSTGKTRKNFPPEHYVGKKYGMLLMVETTEDRRKIKALCDCGETKIIFLASARNGATFSCGCAPRRVTRNPKGFTANKRTFYSWQDMRRRCYDPKRTHDYPHYGGRGITVCERWNESFENFITDMGPKPDGYSMERKDVNKPYCPENCIWLPKPLQMNNTRLTRYVAFGGQKLCAKDACRRAGISYSAWKWRTKRLSDQGAFDILLLESY